MKQIQNPDDIFNLLENADDETIHYLSENYLSADADEMERIFQKSEWKYEVRSQKSSDSEEILISAQEKNIRNSGLYRSILAMAGCLLLTFGAVAGILKLKPVSHVEAPTFSNVSETTESICTTAAEQAEIYTETTYVTNITTQLPATETTTKVTTETTATSVSTAQTTGNTTESSVETVLTSTETMILPEAAAPETSPEIPETEELTETVPETAAQEIPETEELSETIPETAAPETETETTQNHDSVFYIKSTDYSEEMDFSYIVNSVNVYPDENAPDGFEVYYMPSWLPEGENLVEIATGDTDSVSFIYKKEKAQNIIVHQYLQNTFQGLAPQTSSENQENTSGMTETPLVYTTVGQNPACYFSWTFQESADKQITSYILYWKQGGYIMWLETYNLSLEDTFHIAESCVPSEQH